MGQGQVPPGVKPGIMRAGGLAYRSLPVGQVLLFFDAFRSQEKVPPGEENPHPYLDDAEGVVNETIAIEGVAKVTTKESDNTEIQTVLVHPSETCTFHLKT